MNPALALVEREELADASLIEVGIRAACRRIDTTDGPQAMVEWQHDPVGWADRYLGIPAHTLRWSLNRGYESHEWDGTPDPIARMMECVAEVRNACIEAGTGTGKSFGCAVLTLWYLAVFEDSRVFSYAPSEDQLRQFMWAEISSLWPRFQKLFPQAELTDLRIRMRPGTDKWGARGYSVRIRAGERSAVGAQGAHAERMLLIVEEGPGVHPAIYTALENTRTGDLNVQVVVGNPDSVEDPAHQFAMQPAVEHIIASALDFPNVVTGLPIIPGGVSRRAVESRRWKYRNLPVMFDSRVRGIAPELAVGVALRVGPRNFESFSLRDVREAHRQRWRWYAGIDFGAWRFSFLLGAVDRAGRVHIIDEVFSQFGDTLDDRARAIDRILTEWEVPRERLVIVGDSANPTDIVEINRAFRRLRRPWTVGAVAKLKGQGAGGTKGPRATAVEKIRLLLANGELLFRRELGAGLEWREGANSASDGDERHGSRLLWELKRWAYPEPRPGEPQAEDPDDATADGADAIAALRYLIMTWLQRPKKDQRKPKRNPNADASLEKLQRALRRIHNGGRA